MNTDMEFTNNFTITIFSVHKAEVEKKLLRLKRKADKAGVYFVYTFGSPYIKRIRCGVEDFATMVIDVTINREIIRQNGWTVVAEIQHFREDVDNIVTVFQGKINPDWYKIPARCDHCGTNRYRKSTFICEKEGELKQVGSTCLKEYTGIDPPCAVLWAEAEYPESVQEWYGDEDKDFFSGVPHMYSTERVLGLAIDQINAYGYIKSTEPNNTKVNILHALAEGRFTEEDESQQKAKEIISWLLEEINPNPDKHIFYELEANCIPFAVQGYVEPRNIGYLAYLPVAYDRYMEKKAQREAQRQVSESSAHVGAVGDKLNIAVTSARLVTSWENDFGTVNMYKFTDTAGNIYIWKTTKWFKDVKKITTLHGTVKEHNIYNGEAQTILTRCKVA